MNAAGGGGGAPPVTVSRSGVEVHHFAPAVEALENEGAYAMMARAADIAKSPGPPVVHLEIGQPSYPTPSHITAAAMAALSAGETKYSPPAGIPALRAAIAAHVSSTRGVDVHPEQVVVGPGAKPGLLLALLALVRAPGDVVVIPDPGFPSYAAAVSLAGGVPVRVPVGPVGYDISALRRVARGEAGRCVAIIVNSPGNPTGCVLGRAACESVAAVAIEADAFVLSDEIYSGLVYEGQPGEPPYTSMLSLPGMAARTVLVDGFSKTFAMTGWRLGYAVCPPYLADRMSLLLVHAVGCTATFVQHAGVAALVGLANGEDAALQGMRTDYRRRRDAVVAGLNAIEGVSAAVPGGAFYVWANVSAFSKFGYTAAELASMLLEEGRVAVLPGTDFGPGGEGYLRLSYVGEDAEVIEGVARIKTVLDRLRGAG